MSEARRSASLLLMGSLLVACHAPAALDPSGSEYEESPLASENSPSRLPTKADMAQVDAESLAFFQKTLAPYGTWFDHSIYGEVWIPHAVGVGFVPYVTSGRWVYTPEGFSWSSQHPWGWATFHYGRWVQVGALGGPTSTWAWIPDTRWAPAWVDWRYGGGWVAWSPTPPARGVRAGRQFSLPPMVASWFAVVARELLAEHLDARVIKPQASPRIMVETRELPVVATTRFRGPPPHMLGLSPDELARSAALASDLSKDPPTRVVGPGALLPRTTVVLRSNEPSYDPAPAPPPAAAPAPPPPAPPSTVVVAPVIPYGYHVPSGVYGGGSRGVVAPPAYAAPRYVTPPSFGASTHPAWSAFDASFGPRVASPMGLPPTSYGVVPSAPRAMGGPAPQTAAPAAR